MDFHSLNRPPYSFEIFSTREKINTISFFESSFYRNYTLYENIFKYNTNVFLITKEFKKIPDKPLPAIFKFSPDLNYEDPKSIKIIQSFFFTKEKKKEIKIESDETVYIQSELNLEKVKNFVNSFYKNTNSDFSEKTKIDQIQQNEIAEFETQEVKAYLNLKLPNIIKEANEGIELKSKEKLNEINNRITNLTVIKK
jgi:hypothetical protein